MDESSKVYVGLDVHKDTIAIAQAAPGRDPARLMGEIAHDVNRLIRKLQPLGDPAGVRIVYEAGPTGYGLQRKLRELGYACEIIAPSLIPKRAGDRVKTDRRDCLRLAELSRAGELKAIWIPDPADEAIRELSRAREDAVTARTRARHQLRGFLLRHDIRYPGKTAWTKTFGRWLATLSFEAPGSQIAFTEYCLAVQSCDARVERLSLSLLQAIQGWRFEKVVRALCALRGIDAVSAIGLVAEIGDIARFDHPRKLMGYLGLVPSERSSGERVNRGPITKSGNAQTADRGGLVLSIQTQGGLPGAAQAGGSARVRARHRVEGAAAIDRALRQAARARRHAQQGLRGRRTGTCRLCLGRGPQRLRRALENSKRRSLNHENQQIDPAMRRGPRQEEPSSLLFRHST